MSCQSAVRRTDDQDGAKPPQQLCLMVDQKVKAADAEHEIGTKQLASCLAGVDEACVVELRLSKTETTTNIAIGSSSRRAVMSTRQLSVIFLLSTTDGATAAAQRPAGKFEAAPTTQ